jgi:Rrf2 family protein
MRTDYALRALLTLVEHYGRGPISIRELAQLNDVPKGFLGYILAQMKLQGWVDSVRGKDGGYVLVRPPDEITAVQVVRYFDGILAPLACVSTSHHVPCGQEAACRFRRLLLDVRNRVVQLMDNTTLAEISRGAPVEDSEVFDLQLTNGAGI